MHLCDRKTRMADEAEGRMPLCPVPCGPIVAILVSFESLLCPIHFDCLVVVNNPVQSELQCLFVGMLSSIWLALLSCGEHWRYKAKSLSPGKQWWDERQKGKEEQHSCLCGQSSCGTTSITRSPLAWPCCLGMPHSSYPTHSGVGRTAVAPFAFSAMQWQNPLHVYNME